jgi:hypothetical protein
MGAVTVWLLGQGHGGLFSNTRAHSAGQRKKVLSKAAGGLPCLTKRPHQGGGSTGPRRPPNSLLAFNSGGDAFSCLKRDPHAPAIDRRFKGIKQG